MQIIYLLAAIYYYLHFSTNNLNDLASHLHDEPWLRRLITGCLDPHLKTSYDLECADISQVTVYCFQS